MSVRVIQGDCRTMLATLPDASVQCCVTSPPYFGLRDYQVAGQIGLEQTPDAYVAEMVSVFREVRRVLADNGTCWLNLGDSYCSTDKWGGGGNVGKQTVAADGSVQSWHVRNRKQAMDGIKPKDLLGIPWAVAFALRADGWWLRSAITWCKTAPMPESVVDRPTSATEMVFLLTKRDRYFYDSAAVAEPAVSEGRVPGGNHKVDSSRNDADRDMSIPVGSTRNLRNWWALNPEQFSGSHFAVMPSALAERCVRAGSSERGQCPHCGAPWARVVEVERQATRPGHPIKADESRNDGGRAARVVITDARTTGWSPTCACPAHTPVPQTVLDPFGGAGTTGLVADRLGRNAVLIELNPDYAKLARNRVTADAPLFAEVAD